MRKFVLLFILNGLAAILTCSAQQPDWQWARAGAGPLSEYGGGIKTDGSGNIYVAGTFESDSIVLDTIVLYNARQGNSVTQAFNDIFIAKYNAAGAIQWAKRFGLSTSSEDGRKLAIDANGDIYMAGQFQGSSLVFGSITLTNATNSADMYLVKFSPSGTVLWARSVGGPDSQFPVDICSDSGNNICVTGSFASSSVTIGATTLSNAGGSCSCYDMFVAKYDSLGNVLWARRAGGTADDGGSAINADADDNLLVTGYFKSSSVVFGSTTLTNASSGTGDIYVVKYDAAGTALWAKRAGGTSDDAGSDIDADTSGAVYVTGYYQNSAVFNTTTVTGGGSHDFFIASYDASGTLAWVRSAGGSAPDRGTGIVTDVQGNSLVTGVFNSATIDLGGTVLSVAGGEDIFIAEYSSTGTVNWAMSAGGTNNESPRDICTDMNSAIFITGSFRSDTVDFGTTALVNTSVSDLRSDIVLAKLSSQFTLLGSSEPVTCSGDCDGEATVTAMGGEQPYTYLWDDPDGQTTATATGLCPGTYTVTVTGNSSAVLTETITIAEALPILPVPAISPDGNLYRSNHSTGNEWYMVGNPALLGSQQIYMPTATGDYYFIYTDGNGCWASSDTVSVIVTGIQGYDKTGQVIIYPNPFSECVNFHFSGPLKEQLCLVISTTCGQVLKAVNIPGGLSDYTLSLTGLAAGIYIIKAGNNKPALLQKL